MRRLPELITAGCVMHGESVWSMFGDEAVGYLRWRHNSAWNTSRYRSLDPVRWPLRLIIGDRHSGSVDSLAPRVSSWYTHEAAIQFVVVRARSHAVIERKKIRHMPTCQRRGVFGTKENKRINRWTRPGAACVRSRIVRYFTDILVKNLLNVNREHATAVL